MVGECGSYETDKVGTNKVFERKGKESESCPILKAEPIEPASIKSSHLSPIAAAAAAPGGSAVLLGCSLKGLISLCSGK